MGELIDHKRGMDFEKRLKVTNVQNWIKAFYSAKVTEINAKKLKNDLINNKEDLAIKILNKIINQKQ